MELKKFPCSGGILASDSLATCTFSLDEGLLVSDPQSEDHIEVSPVLHTTPIAANRRGTCAWDVSVRVYSPCCGRT